MAKQSRQYKCVALTTGATKLYLFAAPASELWEMLDINRRSEDKNEGYQRAISGGRVAAIRKFITEGNTIPTALTVSLDEGATYDNAKGVITIPAGSSVGWVIDGQHRLAGAAAAVSDGTDIQMPTVAFIGLSLDEQINQFITINREAKGVPTSLYLDLLGVLKNKKPQDVAKERASDICLSLRQDETSPFYERVVVTRAPQAGEISLTNFVRKVAPLVLRDKGILSSYYEKEQRLIIDNYFKGLMNVYPEEFRRPDPIFFRTIGFGAMMNALPAFFSACLTHQKGFTANDTTKVFKRLGELPFDNWREMGSGSAAEIGAGEDVRTAIELAFRRDEGGSGGTIRL